MKHTGPALLTFTCVCFAEALFAQQSVDLDAPELKAHATLLQNDLNSPTPLQEKLSEARPKADARGIPWKGLTILTTDEIGGIAPSHPNYEIQTCRADLIVTGRPRDSRYHLSARGTSIYGDYDIALESVLKQYQGTTVAESSHIVVTRPGGDMTLSSGHVNVDPEGWPRLQLGMLYLQFLRHIPESNGWQPLDNYSTLVLVAGNWSWFFARAHYNHVPTATFPQASFESNITQWLQSCKR